jgi:alpha-L-fucosidase
MPIEVPELSAAMYGTQTSITEKEYTALPARFNPVDFDPDTWAQLVKEAASGLETLWGRWGWIPDPGV